MVRFTEEYVTELDEFHSKGLNSFKYVALCYVRGVAETLGVIALLYCADVFEESYYHENVNYLVYNTFATYATVSITFNSLLSCIMHFGGGNDLQSFIPLMVSGAAKIQVFHPHTIYRNVITRPVVAGLIYAIVVCLNVVTLNPPRVNEVLTPQFFGETLLTGCGINTITGLLKTLIWHWAWKREPIFKVKTVLEGVHCGSKTTPDTDRHHDEDSPQNDHLDPISEDGEYVPPKVQSYFSCSV